MPPDQIPGKVNAMAASFIRTGAAIVAGALLTWLVRQGVTLDGGFAQPLTEGLVAAFTAVYYAVARALEHWVNPRFGWLLGLPSQPQYTPPVAPHLGLPGDGTTQGGAPS